MLFANVRPNYLNLGDLRIRKVIDMTASALSQNNTPEPSRDQVQAALVEFP